MSFLVIRNFSPEDDGSKCVLVSEGYAEEFRYNFDLDMLFRHHDLWKEFGRGIHRALEDWMLGLPGDITEIEKTAFRAAENELTTLFESESRYRSLKRKMKS